MNSIQPFVDDLSSRVLGALAAVLAGGAVLALVGLAAGVALVLLCQRKGLFRRAGTAWSWVARLNYVYVPVLLLLLGGSLGAVLGAHRSARGWIDDTREPLAGYARGYLAEFQSSLNAQAGIAQGSGVTVEELVARQMRPDAVENRFAREALLRVNVAIVRHVVDQVAVPAEMERPVDAVRRLDVSDLSASTFSLLPRAMHQAANSFFVGQYLAVLLFFAPFLLLPLAEYGAHAFHRRRSLRRSTTATSVPAAG